MWTNPQESADLVTFTEEMLSGKLHVLRSDYCEERQAADFQGVWVIHYRFQA